MKYLVTDAELTSLADAIRSKTGSGLSIAFPEGFITEIGKIPTETDMTDYEMSIMLKTLSGSYANSYVTQIGDYGLNDCSQLTSVSFPNCIKIGDYGFSGCGMLTNVTVSSNCTEIGNYAFHNCSSLSEAMFSRCTSLGLGAFQGCSNISRAYFSSLEVIHGDAFAGCSNLQQISFPRCTEAWRSAFYGCCQITSVYLSQCTAIGAGCFQSCTKLESVSLPRISESIPAYAFYDCHKLSSIRFPASTITTIATRAFLSTGLTSLSLSKVTSIYDQAFMYCDYLSVVRFSQLWQVGVQVFYGCQALVSVYLLSTEAIRPITNWSNWFSMLFYGTPIHYGTGTIYVRSQCYDYYIHSSMYSAYSSRFSIYTP